MLCGSSVMVTAPALYASLACDMQRDYAPITQVGANAYVLRASCGAGAPEEFARLIRSETDKWFRIIKAAGIRPEQQP